MSLINQMLQDLDARRASVTELALVPRYVRSLPRAERPRVAWWGFAAAGAGIGVAAALVWQFASSPPAAAPIVQPAAHPAAVPAIAASEPPKAPPQAAPREAPPGFVPASALIAREMPGGAVREPPIEPARPAKPPAVIETPEQPPPKPARALEPARQPAPAAAASVGPPQIDKRIQQPSPRELSESEFRDATTLLHQGRTSEAQEKFRLALQHFGSHAGARQALVGLLIKSGRLPEAEQVLQEGLRANGPQPAFAMALARLQVDRGDATAAVETLQRSAAAAHGSADYIAFLAALL
jgi:hypothetical protein